MPGEFLWRTRVEPGSLEPTIRVGPRGKDQLGSLPPPPPSFFFVRRKTSAGLTKSLS